MNMKKIKFAPIVRRAFPYSHNHLVDDLVPDYDDQGRLLPMGVHTSLTQCMLIPVQVGESMWVFFSDIKADRRELKKMSVKQMVREFPEAVTGICRGQVPDHYEYANADMVAALLDL